ncbi:alpha/beta hydrolase [Streptomyces sp. A7024]|uniref:Alpha/beta hydrolase n=1 Tax=Streptomyces coryli TaxID=1128680 RepID=A0A6G4TTI5_9ACTN|nr:alpha/beta hydrolase [Streptomyces coryli]NGN62337.1 alpha/beta hydrolase [Streptomyces coryli]
MSSGSRLSRRGFLGAAAAGALTALGSTGTARAADAVEQRYAAPGPRPVTAADVTGYRLVYPADLGAGDVLAPIVTWGNGTGSTPAAYDGLLRHLASWGFAVVASVSTATAKGTEMLDGARYLVAQNGAAGSVFEGRLDTGRVGAAGHSQGAGGAVNATTASGGLITTTVPVALPDERWVSPGDEFYPERLTHPVFFLGGSQDVIIAPPATLRGFYDRVPGAAAMAVLTGAGHNVIQGNGGGFRGYLTAWLRYRLAGDGTAAGAFTGTTPEITTNSAWQNQALKNLSRGAAADE